MLIPCLRDMTISDVDINGRDGVVKVQQSKFLSEQWYMHQQQLCIWLGAVSEADWRITAARSTMRSWTASEPPWEVDRGEGEMVENGWIW